SRAPWSSPTSPWKADPEVISGWSATSAAPVGPATTSTAYPSEQRGYIIVTVATSPRERPSRWPIVTLGAVGVIVSSPMLLNAQPGSWMTEPYAQGPASSPSVMRWLN